MNIATFLDRLDNVHRNGSGWTARCPAHDDDAPSLSINEGDDGRVLVHCHAGCDTVAIVAAMGLTMRDLFAQNGTRGEGVPDPINNFATLQQSSSAGCTLDAYAGAKMLPLDFLKSVGVSEMHYITAPAVRIPYRDTSGVDAAVQFRVRLTKGENGEDRFKWKSGSKTCLYGQWRLDHARETGYVWLVEGASDCHTLWFHGEPAVGIPGAGDWKDARDASHLVGIDRIFVVIEPDAGGDNVLSWLSKSSIRDRVHIVRLDRHQDVSELHVADPDQFDHWLNAARDAATSYTNLELAMANDERDTAWALCRDLATQPYILDTFAASLTATGFAGSTRAAKIVFLAMVSRLLDRPVSAVIKGPSSAGKSYVVERTTRYFPESSYYALTAMSDRALAYDDEPVSHRVLILYEAAGISGETATYMVRSLLSEGEIRYLTVEKTSDGLRKRLIHRQGPTALLMTTTAVLLHPENETRLLSIPVDDTREQTRQVMAALAAPRTALQDLTPWHALQVWLDHSSSQVVIPFAPTLAAAMPPVAVRLRRDLGALLSLIRTHAILHQFSRERDSDNQIVATVEDYSVVRDLVVDLMSEGLEATVPPTIRETVAAVAALLPSAPGGVSIMQTAKHLKLDKSATSRRVSSAVERGYLANLEDRKGKPSRLVVAEPMPDDLAILPEPECLRECCSVAVLSEGIRTPSLGHVTSTTNADPMYCIECGAPLYVSQAGGRCQTCLTRTTT